MQHNFSFNFKNVPVAGIIGDYGTKSRIYSNTTVLPSLSSIHKLNVKVQSGLFLVRYMYVVTKVLRWITMWSVPYRMPTCHH